MYSIVTKLSGHRGNITGLAVSANNDVLVSTSEDRTVRVWDTANWMLRHVLDDMDQGTHQGIMVFDVSACGRFFASGAPDFTTKVYCLKTGARLSRLHPEKKNSYNSAEQIQFSPDSKYLACAKGKTIELFETNAFSKVGELKGHTSKVHLHEWTHDNQSLISCGGKYVKLWEVANLTEKKELARHKKLLGSLALDPQGEFFLTGGEDNRIFVWSLPHAADLGEYSEHNNFVFDMSISPDGRTVASWDMDETLHIWDRVTGTNIARINGLWGRSEFLPGTGHLIFSDSKSDSLVIAPLSGNVTQKLPSSEVVAAAPHGRWFASTVGREIAIWSNS